MVLQSKIDIYYTNSITDSILKTISYWCLLNCSYLPPTDNYVIIITYNCPDKKMGPVNIAIPYLFHPLRAAYS